MTPATRKTKPLLLLAGAAVVLIVVAMVVGGTLLPFAPEEVAKTRLAPRALTAADMTAAAARATQALRDRDRAAWDAAFPATGDARRAVDALYRHLVRVPWTSVRLLAQPVHGRPGRYYVGAVGAVGGADPADRIMARRVFDAALRGGRPVLLDDVTPADVRGQQIMAFDRPVAVRRNGLVVIADKPEQAAAEALARAGGPARKRLRLLGISSRKPVVVYYYSSRAQLLRSLEDDPKESRIRFFSHPPVQLGTTQSWTRDIGVLGPALAGKEAWIPQMLAHELTHAYTSRWFARTKHAPTLLAEGLATAVEGGRSFQPLRDDLAAGSSAFPLEKALRTKDLWRGNSTAKVRLAYLEGASLVLYVKDRWGLAGLRSFITAVSDSDLTRAGLDEAVRKSVGVGWDELRAGWTASVQTLP